MDHGRCAYACPAHLRSPREAIVHSRGMAEQDRQRNDTPKLYHGAKWCVKFRHVERWNNKDGTRIGNRES
jgi:hypothetical protein